MSVQPTSLLDRSDESIQVVHVDDERQFLELTAEYVESCRDDLTVRTATSAKAGLELIDETEVDCVVSDYEMPGMNGLEFLTAVRRRFPDLPFILMTGTDSDDIVSRAIDAGVTDYLQKEIGTRQYTLLANRIKNAVERHRETQHRRASDLVIDVNRTLLRAETSDDIASSVCQRICAHDSYDFAWIGMADSEGRWMETRVADRNKSVNGHPPNPETAAPVPDGVLATALDTGAIQTTTSKPSELDAEFDGDSHTVAVVPIVRSNRTIGVLCVATGSPDGFDAMERSLLEWLAHDLGSVLQLSAGFDSGPARGVTEP